MYNEYDLYSMIVRYEGATYFVVIFLLVLLYFYIKSEEIYKIRMTIMITLSFLLVFNNIVLRLVGSVIGYAVYYRFFWGVPMIPVIAFAVVKLISMESKISRKVIVMALLTLIVFMGGSNLSTLANQISFPENRYNIPEEVRRVANIINDDHEEERAVIVAGSLINFNIRQYDPSFIWGVRRNAFIDVLRSGPYDWTLNSPEQIIVRVVEFGHQDFNEMGPFREALYDLEIDYIVSFTENSLDIFMEQAGFVVVGRTDMSTIYGRN